MLRLSLALFLVQAGFHGFTASIPLALARVGRQDAEIGAIVGAAPLVQILAALAGGALIDRFGGVRLFVVGGVAYLIATALLFVGGVDPQATPLMVGARFLQGAGFGLAVPAALSVIPRLVPLTRRGVALATAGASHNLSFVVLPPVSIAVLDVAGLAGVSAVVATLVVSGVVLALVRPVPPPTEGESHLGAAKRRFGFAYRRSWVAPLAVTVLFVLHWGVVTAYLPQRAEAAGANIGLFFVADGLFVLLARVPAGWLADRMRPVWLVLGGVAMTATAVALLLLVPTTEILFAAGMLTGIGAALIVIPLMLALTERSADADRGSAFALFSASFAGAIALGSLGTAPLIGILGFEVLLAISLVALVFSAFVAYVDKGMHRPARELRRAPDEQPAVEASTPIGP